MDHTARKKKELRRRREELKGELDSISQQEENLNYDQTHRRHNDYDALAEAITQSMLVNRLPVATPSIFDGDILSYRPWRVAFDMLVTNKPLEAREKLLYLKEYTGTKVHKLIAGVEFLNSNDAFVVALNKLDRRYGDDMYVTEALRNKLLNCDNIKANDYSALLDYADILQQVEMAYESSPGLRILDDINEILKLAKVLPDHTRRKWAGSIYNLKESQGRQPSFKEFVCFVMKEAETYTNPTVARLFEKEKYTSIEKKQPTTSKLTTLATSAKKERCIFCNRNGHDIVDCRTFTNKTAKEKNNFIKGKSLCYGCLKEGHPSSKCRNRKKCTVDDCVNWHPVPVHGIYEELYPNRSSSSSKESKEEVPSNKKFTLNTTVLSTKEDKPYGKVYTMVLPVYISTKENPENEVLIYALLDTQSDTTFISEDTIKELKPNMLKPEDLQLTTMCSTKKITCNRYNGMRVRGLNSSTYVTLPVMYGRKEIPGDYTQIGTTETAKQYNHLRDIQDKLHQLQNCTFGLLIGCNCATALAPINTITSAMPYAQESVLGWCIVGNAVPSDKYTGRTLKTLVQHDSSIQKPNILKKNHFAQLAKILESDFIESKSDDKVMSQEDMVFKRMVEQSIHQNEAGYYEMKLPFRNAAAMNMPNNRIMVEKRLECLKQRMVKNQQYHKDYSQFMINMIKDGDAEQVPGTEVENGNCWYIPHHGIYHHKKPTKMRVVFDCSCTYRGTSLNKVLLQGPNLLNNLIGILCRFRREHVAFIGDIEHMFHQFQVSPQDRDHLRFLWFKDGDCQATPTTYRMKVFLFGAICSPACANYALKSIAKDFRTEENYEAAECLSTNCYVDDLLHSMSTEEEAIKTISDSRTICAKGHLRLHKFTSNSKSVMKSIPNTERQEAKSQELYFDDDNLERVLGLQWCTETDTFQFKLRLREKPLTRRGILSTVASIYDPLGLIAPYTLRGKQILQRMCREEMSWDDPLEGELYQSWTEWTSELEDLENVTIRRCYKPSNFGTVKNIELHYFSDASYSGYGQCTYVRMINTEDKIHCALVMAKARVTPKKVLTMPRLELMAAVTSVKISNLLREELQYDKCEEYYWTDSQIVLAYIQNNARRFHIFIANRIQTILNHTKRGQWRYVQTSENPADYVSRGIRPKNINGSSWLTGPDFLWTRIPDVEPIEQMVALDDPEVRKIIIHKIKKGEFSLTKRLERFSDWNRAVKGFNLLRKICMSKHDILDSTVEEITNTENFIIMSCQNEHFPDEINALLNDDVITNQMLLSLDPFLDDNMVLRVGGRLKRSTINYYEKHPIILPKEGHLSHLIIKHYHEKAEHQGRGLTISTIRCNGFYIIGISRLVASLIFKCVICRRLRHNTQTQKMADLPIERLEPAAPFTYVAIDCFGPYTVTERRKEIKRYGIVFVCQASRAIHLELLDDMSTDCFLNGLRCFMAIRGTVASIRCDQGSNFIGASAELKRAFNEINCTKVKDKLLANKCDFLFNTPESSHMGGTVERHIRTVRSILNNILHTHGYRLDTSSLRTYLYEVMALINSRPLTGTYIHDTQLDPLTPNHLITMKTRPTPPPPGKFDPEDVYSRKRWRRVQHLTQVFWDRWKKEYMVNLQQRHKWKKASRDISVGDIVLVKNEDVYRGDWKLAKVVETIGSKDHTRRVRLLMGRDHTTKKHTFLERPIHKLVLLLENEE